ncbi:clathrin heavy-chain terminal domain-containing protein, partial [Auricularia subglabra TFB-10046 SS5]
MASALKALIVSHQDHLLRVGGLQQGRIEHVNLASNRAAVFTHVSGKQKKSVALDLSDPIAVVNTWQNTDDGAYNPQSMLVVLVGAKGMLYVCDAEKGAKLESHRMNDDVELVRWINAHTVAVVTRSAVWHWRVTRNRCGRPEEWFLRDPALGNATVVDYRVCGDGSWCALMAHEPNIDAREHIPAEGLVQLFSREAGASKLVEAHALDLVESDLTGFPRGMTLCIYAKRTLMSSELRITEINRDGESAFGHRVFPLNFSPDAFDDYPLSLHVSQPHGIIFLTTAMGYVHLYDMESGVQLLRQRITHRNVLTTARNEDGTGIILIDEDHRASRVVLNEEHFIQYLLNNNFQNLQVLFRIADRNQDWKLFAKHHLQLSVARHDEAEAYMRANWCSFETPQPVDETGRLSARLWAGDGTLGVTDTAAYTLRGIVLFLCGMLQDSVKYAREALKTNPDDRHARILLWRAEDVIAAKADGNAAYTKAQYPTAIEHYEKALKQIGDQEEEGHGGVIRAVILNNRAIAYLRSGKHKEAVADASLSLELQPHNWKALRTRGSAQIALRNFDSAVTDILHAMKLCPHLEEKAKLQTELAEAQRGRGFSSGPAVGRPVSAMARGTTPTMPPVKDYYRILNVNRFASDMEIRQAYRQRTLQLHPRNGGNPETYKLLEEGYRTLSNATARRQYDAMLNIQF